MNTIRQDRQTDAVKDQHSENLATYHEWIKKYPAIRDCTATFNAFVEYMAGEDVWLEADLDYALSQIPEGRLVKQRVPTREEVVAEENARRKALSMSELKALARQETPAPTAPTLPTTWEGHNIADAASLKQLSKTDFNSFKRLHKKFSSELINQRLGVQPAAKTGFSISLPL